MNSAPEKTQNKTHEKAHKEPLFHIAKRDGVPFWQGCLIRVGAVVGALILCALITVLLTGKNPIEIYVTMYQGVFGTPRRIWKMLQGVAILLCISLAVTPAFKMQFWNTGAEGQVLIGGLATAACMFYFGGKIPYPALVIAMTVAAIIAGAVWAVIPALFKAKWNTNETLFTLMMNYVAMRLVSFFINTWVKDGSAVLRPMADYGLPKIGVHDYFLNIMVVALLTVAMYIYLRFSKHGYEISVVGQSEKTAKYIGINVKTVIIRTMILSGAICGIAGLLLVGGTDHTINMNTVDGRGFTAIMVSWLAKFNPLYMILTSFLVVFLQQGSVLVSTNFRLDDSLSDIITAIVLFFIIGCEFFINYKIVFRSHAKEVK